MHVGGQGRKREREESTVRRKGKVNVKCGERRERREQREGENGGEDRRKEGLLGIHRCGWRKCNREQARKGNEIKEN